VRLPRSKVATIHLGASTPTAAAPPAKTTNSLSLALLQGMTNEPALTNSSSLDLAAAFRQLGTNSPLVQQVQSQFLGDAGPEANQKFNELLGGLMSGKLSLGDIRSQAKTAAEQIRAVRKDLGDDVGDVMDTYLAVLDGFLKQTEPAASTNSTNAPAVSAERGVTP